MNPMRHAVVNAFLPFSMDSLLRMKAVCGSMLGILLLIGLSASLVEASKLEPTTIRLIRERYGLDIARLYRHVEGMPRFWDAEPLPILRYRREESPCNQLFVQENPEMAEKCNYTRETLIIENRYHKKLTVHIVGEDVESMEFTIPLDNRDPLKCRKVTLLQDAFIVHDLILKNYSHNHAKIYFFPTGSPRVELDMHQNLMIHFGSQDYIKFMADDFRRTSCRGFRWRLRTTICAKGARSIPDIAYTGEQPCMMTVNWSYPPIDGFLNLFNHTRKVGRIPASVLYEKQKDLRAEPRFMENGLLAYLKNICVDERIRYRYSSETRRSIQELLD